MFVTNHLVTNCTNSHTTSLDKNIQVLFTMHFAYGSKHKLFDNLLDDLLPNVVIESTKNRYLLFRAGFLGAFLVSAFRSTRLNVDPSPTFEWHSISP